MTKSLCADQEYCLLVALPVTNTHLCSACGVHVHAICGELCEDAGITYHTTCFECFKKYGVILKDPEDYLTIKGLQIHSSGEEQDDSTLQPGNEDWRDDAEFSNLCNKETTPPTATATAVSAATDKGTATNLSAKNDLYRQVVVNDNSVEKAEKTKKRQDFIQKLTLSQCVVHHDGSSSAVLVSIAGIIPHSNLLLNDLMLFCATHKISGHRQKKKAEVLLLIAACVALDVIYASIGRRGMHDDNTNKDDGTTVVSTGKTSKKRAYKSKLTRPQAVTKTGTYFRAISLWFAVENRHLVLATGKKMNRAELDAGGYQHKPIWKGLAEEFNTCTGIPRKSGGCR